MTVEEFKKIGFRSGDRVNYKGKVCLIAQIDFEECLFGVLLNISGGEPDDVSWVRCENCEFIGL